MNCRLVLASAIGLLLGNAVAFAQPAEPSSAEQLLQPPAAPMAEPPGQFIHAPGWYGAGGILVAPPIFFDAAERHSSSSTAVLSPIPAAWAAIGFRRASDVSWQVSTLLVPLVQFSEIVFDHPLALVATGLDIDRISTNRSAWTGLDFRWQAGLRIVGIGIGGIPIPLALGPHLGVRLERPLANGLFLRGWSDVGVLPSLFDGIPLVDLRGELALAWRSSRRPGLSASVGLFNEIIGLGPFGLMTPGITARFGWNF